MDVPNGSQTNLTSAPAVDAAAPAVVTAEVPAASLVVILAKKESSVRQTVNFLERRGISARYVTSLNDAVDMFSRKEANMLLLSVNFPHPKVEMLPVLMNQSFAIETIVYAEETDRKSSSRLSNAKTKHILFGPVSGPVVMMKVRQIEREMAGSTDDGAAEGANSRGANEKAESDDIKIGGRKPGSDDDSFVLNGNATGEKAVALDQLKRALAEAEEASAEAGDLQRSGETYIQKGQRSKMNSAVEDGDMNALLSARAQSLRAGLDRGLKEPELSKSSLKRRLLMPSEFKNSAFAGSGDSTIGDSSPSGDVSDSVTKAQKKFNRAAIDAATRSGDEGSNEDHVRSGDLASAKASQSARASEQINATLSPAPIQPRTQDEVILACLKEALAIVAGAPKVGPSELGEYSKAALISLRTAKFNCAFVVAIAFAKQTANELFHRIEIAFFSLLRDNGLEFESRDTFSILIDDMKIVQRAFLASDFTAVTQRNDLEIGVARVLVNNPIATVEPYDENMLSVSLLDIPLDAPVTYNVFLHLKLNRKYIRYLKEGSSLSDPQVTRLEQQHPNVILDQNDVEAYRRHYAAHSIRAPKSRTS